MNSWDPAEYARSSAAQMKWAEDLLSRLNLQGSEAVLDLGCGDGKITAALAQALPRGRAVGVDSSDEMVGYAQANYTASGYANLAFRLLDVRALDYTHEFDLVFSNAALHWVADHKAILTGANRALRHGGRLALSFGGKGNAAAVLRIVSALGGRAGWQQYFQRFENPYFFYGSEEYRPWLDEAGFVTQRLELVPKDMGLRGAKGLVSWIRTTWMPIMSRVPESKREEFVRDFATAYLEAFPADSEGNVHVQMMRLEVEAVKP